MKRSMLTLLALVVACGLMFSASDAEARRMGGGMSSGMKRNNNIMRRDAAPTPSQAPSQNSATSRPMQSPPASAPAAPGMSRWLGPLAGVAAGVGLASMFSHFGMGGMGGMGGGFSSLLMLLLVGGGIVLLFKMWSQRNAAAAQPMQYSGAGNVSRFEPTTIAAGSAGLAVAPAAAALSVGQIPADFDVDGFLRQAKLNFVRLQAANDAGNMEDIRAFTTPEMFAEIQVEFHERNKTAQQSDVMQLNAVLLDVTSEEGRQIVSVRYSGTIRETPNVAPEAFDEVWHLVRPMGTTGGWIIAGIQQFE